MKHSAKAAAKMARKQARLARRRAAGAPGPTVTPSSGQREAVNPEDVATSGGDPGAVSPAHAVLGERYGQVNSGNAAATLRRHGVDPGETAAAGRRRLAQLPYALVLTGTVLGLALMWIAGQAVKSGTLVIAGALLAGAVARLALPDSKAGLLRSRRRLVDVAALTALGIGLLVAGLVVQVPG